MAEPAGEDHLISAHDGERGAWDIEIDTVAVELRRQAVEPLGKCRFFRSGVMPTASQPESFVSFRTPASFSRCSSLRIFPNALSAKIKPINPNMKPMLPTLHLHLSNK